MRTALVVAALALPLAATAQPAPEYQPTGEVVLRVTGAGSSGASFDEERIIGPAVNLEQSDGGAWVGDIGGSPVDLEVSGTKVSGVGVDLFVKHEKDRLTIRGNVMNRRVWVELTEKKISGRAGDCSLDLARNKQGFYVGNIGCSRGVQLPQTARAELRLDGTAAQKNPPHPQFALALTTVLLL